MAQPTQSAKDDLPDSVIVLIHPKITVMRLPVTFSKSEGDIHKCHAVSN